MLGETKFSSRKVKADSLVREAARDLRYYVSLPCEPEKGWEYDFGFGVAYAGGGEGRRIANLLTSNWGESRFVVACFRGPSS
jgi:hypothetical protein